MKFWKAAGKVAITALLLYLVSRKVDLGFIRSQLQSVRPLPLAAGFLLYFFSRILGALRLHRILRSQSIWLSWPDNLRLYWVSMFYGIFLPGGLGADAYKVIYLKKRNPGTTTLALTSVMLWDRIIGLLGLLNVAVVPAALLLPGSGWLWLALPLLLVQIPLVGWAIARWMPAMRPATPYLLALSFLIQFSQIGTILLIMTSIGVTHGFLEYTLVFLASSIASMLPVTIGGVGIREMVFLYGSRYLGTSEGFSVTSGLLFDVFVTLLALTGAFFLFRSSEEKNIPSVSEKGT